MPVLVTALALAGGAVVAPPAAQASRAQDHIVSENPVNYTPNVENDAAVRNARVNKFAKLGETMYAGGLFRTVTNAARTKTYVRRNLLAFSATDGTVRSFAPQVDGEVFALAAGGSSALYVGGKFTTVNGRAARGLVKLNLAGQVDTRFRPPIPSGAVYDVQLVDGRLIVAGSFPKRLLALNPTTGADTGYLDLGISGSLASNAGPTRIYRFAVNPARTRLVAIGNFTSVSGRSRRQAFMASLGTSSARLGSWYSRSLDLECRSDVVPAYLRDVDFAPDGRYFVVVSTGFSPQTADEVGEAICDAAARFETDDDATATATWINYTGGDTLHSVAVTGATVYVGGHQRWLDNPQGRNFAGPGAVSRPGIGSISPTTGKATAWNPTKTRGIGVKDLFVTSTGLWVGSDGERFAGEYRNSIAFCPL